MANINAAIETTVDSIITALSKVDSDTLVSSVVGALNRSTREVFLTAQDNREDGFLVAGVTVRDEGDEVSVELSVEQLVAPSDADAEMRSILDGMSVTELQDAYRNGGHVADEVNDKLDLRVEEMATEDELRAGVVAALSALTGIDADELEAVVSVYVDQDHLDQLDEWGVRVVAEEYLDAEGEPYEPEDDDEEW